MGLDNPLHIAFLVVILLLVFGAKRLPEIGRSLGSGMREFKDSVTRRVASGDSPTRQRRRPPAGSSRAQPQPAQQAAPAAAARAGSGRADAPGLGDADRRLGARVALSA